MHPNRVSQFLDISLNNLQLDYIDLYLIHWPMGLTFVSEDELMPRNKNGELFLDMNTNLEEIWLAMEDLVEKGKVRSIGLSNCNIQQISRILNVCKIPPTNLQVEIHIYFQQIELREFCKKHDISVSAFAPLASPGRKKYINAHKL
jgi:diketogulonate reductase-like aldo/keto reductase